MTEPISISELREALDTTRKAVARYATNLERDPKELEAVVDLMRNMEDFCSLKFGFFRSAVHQAEQARADKNKARYAALREEEATVLVESVADKEPTKELSQPENLVKLYGN